MKKIITYGTFDLLHRGHINILKRAAELGEHLTVMLSTDEFNAGKHKQAYHSYEDRKYILESIKYVDEVLPETSWNQKVSDIQNNDISVFVMGDDWNGEFDFLKEYCDVKYLSRTPNISTSLIKSNLKK
jgi:glycerol-3-phosphate cytidylyltransferase